MSLRSRFPAARVSSSHFFVTISRGDRLRQVAFRPWVLWSAACVAPLFIMGFIGATAYVFFHDDLLSAMMRRQSDMQYAYEDRLAAMRAQLDRVTSRQLLDQDTLEGRVHELLSRQAQIENRSAIISMLAEQAGIGPDATATIPRPASLPLTKGKASSVNPLLTPGSQINALPPGVSAFAPIAPPRANATAASVLPSKDDKPRPEVVGDQHSEISGGATLAALADQNLPVASKLRSLVNSLDSQEIRQVRAVSLIGARARDTASRLRSAVADAGLNVDRLAVPARGAQDKPMGGPFVPLKADPNGSLFEREVFRLQNDFAVAAKMRQVLPYLPVRKPLEGVLDVTSPFGGRPDPFFGRYAVHTGLDLREPLGSPVRATGAGKVVSAGWAGGYGNLVEIDHGNGLITRYGHLSAILVSEDQWVDAGAIIGKLGSTGRSTGPHLHYEVRVNNEPVDPQRFLKAGARAFGNG